MGEHYYTNQPQSASNRQEFEYSFAGKDFRFVTDSGVFSKGSMDKGTETLLEAPLALGTEILDMCCGWGAIGVVLAASRPESRIAMVDVNERAVDLARENIRRHGLQNARAWANDGFAGMEERFDSILMNPPIRAGKSVVQTLFQGAHACLNAGGRLYVVMRKAQGAPSGKDFLKDLFGNVETVRRKGGYHIFFAEKS